ncbi:hypothetical protein SAMN05443633_10344 [Chryseobacterium arachidis]|uniref:Uncharacterized protein n=1 Tax=Chryseobacterium arachidis TaxID=1416778 RepID=A0A1M4Z3M2_9FLAO|nr:hypothetical protein [Chryseobacterium arachidis]SHF12631.1 hypothetical protein SAMN05443633_10344 [Chryseobacterium arachidis]
MAKELYFIKTNPVVAKINLYNKLCREENNVLEFLEDDKKTSLELIKKKLQEENVDNLSKEELSGIFNWFREKYNSTNPEEVKTQLFVHGIDVFHQLSSSHIGVFQQILSDYEKYTQHKLSFKTNAEQFFHFLIYGIFFTGLINKEKGEANYLLDYLKLDHKDLFSFAENEFSLKKQDLISDENIYPDFELLYDSTKFYKGSIIKL